MRDILKWITISNNLNLSWNPQRRCYFWCKNKAYLLVDTFFIIFVQLTSIWFRMVVYRIVTFWFNEWSIKVFGHFLIYVNANAFKMSIRFGLI